MKKFIANFLLLIVLLSASVLPERAFAYEEVTGEFKNLAVAVEFSDTTEEDEITPSDLSALDAVFNGEETSLKSFIYRNSQGKLSVETSFLKTVKIGEKSSRYAPRYSLKNGLYQEINPDGYDNRNYDENGEVSPEGKLQSVDYFNREHEFVALVAELLEGESVDGADRDGDGLIDGLTIVLCPTVKVNMADKNEWGEFFWPHMAVMYYGSSDDISDIYYVGENTYEFKDVSIGGKTVSRYVVAPYSSISDGSESEVSVICHEFMHLLGAPDYYGYDTEEEYVGAFDIMGSSAKLTLSLTYLRERMGWLGDGEVLAVEESGEFFLTPTENGGTVKAYKIALSDYLKSGDCYYIECRKLSADDDGIIIYRVNENAGYINADGELGRVELGNIYGNPEVYIFRRESAVKDLKKNAFLDNVLYRSSVYHRKNIIKTSEGEDAGITVEVTGKKSGGYSFRVTIPESPEGNIADGVSAEIKTNRKGGSYLTFENSYRKGYAYVLVTDKNIKDCSFEDILSGKYGEAKKIPVSFQKCDLPKSEGGKYAYLCLSDGENHSEVYTLGYGFIESNGGYMLYFIASGAVGLTAFIAIAVAIKLSKRR